MFKRTLLLLSFAAVITGCASDEALRKASGQLALRIDQVNQDAEKFVAARTNIMKARTATLALLETNALDSEQSNQTQLSYRAAAGDVAWIELVEQLRKAPDLVTKQRKAQAAMSRATTAALNDAKSAVDFKTAKLNAASMTLATLAEQRDDKETLEFYAAFFKEVRKSIQEKVEKAESITREAATDIARKGAKSASK